MKFESFSDLFKPPFLVAKESGEVKELVPDPSIEPRLVLVFDPPIADDVPVALVTLSDGGGAFVRFDSWPPKYSTLEVSRYGQRVPKEIFVRRVNALMAAV